MKSLPGECAADVAIVGLGTFGALTAWRLSKVPGVRVVAFDQYQVPHQHGGYGGESRLLRAAYHEGARYVPLLLRARQLWHELARDSGRDVFLPTGVLTIAERGRPELERVLDCVRQFGLPHAVLGAGQLAAAFPQHRADRDELAVLDLLGGVLRSELAVLSAVELAGKAGVTVHAGEPVLSVETDGNDAVVTTRRHRVRARTAVCAAGVWTAALLPALAAALTVRTLVLTWFLAPAAGSFGPLAFPAFIRDCGPVHLFGAPSLDGVTVKVSAGDIWGSAAEPGTPGVLAAGALDQVGAAVAELLPGLPASPIRHSVYQDAYTADKTPIIGFADPSATVLVAAGFSGHGFKLAPVVGEIAARLALGQEPGFEIDPFAPSHHRSAQQERGLALP